MRYSTIGGQGLILAVLLVGTHPAPAQTPPQDGTIVGTRPYQFPSYADAYGYTRLDGSQDAIDKYWTQDEYERAVADDGFQFEKLIYTSDGLKVLAYVYRARQAETPTPTIVFNRGSGVHKDIAPVLLPYFHRLAREGFVIVAPMYRQSDGGEGIDANGGDDLHDLLNILPVVRSLPYADADNLFMTGESRGAMMVYQAIREGFPMRAAAVWGGFTDLGPLMEAQPALADYAAAHWPGFDAEQPQESIERRSAIHWPEAFHVPVLLMHGESDRSVPVEHTYNLARALQERGRLYGLIVFADDNHILLRSQQERDRATVRWFKRFDSATQARFMDYLRSTASEREVNDAGYSKLRRGDIEGAVDIFRINVQRFPDSANAHDSLGEALATTGDFNGAIECYQRALDLETTEDGRARIRDMLSHLENSR